MKHFILLIAFIIGASALDVKISTVFSTPSPNYPTFLSTSHSVILAGNDGSAATGGVKAFSLTGPNNSTLWDKRTGRTKAIGNMDDWVLTLSQEDYLLRAISSDGNQEVILRKVWGDPSTLCTWNSGGRWYVYLLGKRQGRMLLVSKQGKSLTAVEIQVFILPIEPDACAVNTKTSVVYFGGTDKKLYSFSASESAETPTISTVLTSKDEIKGLAVYHSKNSQAIFIGHEDSVEVLSSSGSSIGEISFTGLKDIEIGGIALLQTPAQNFPQGILGLAAESDEKTGFALASLFDILTAFKIPANPVYVPTSPSKNLPSCPRLQNCNSNGFCNRSGLTCSCFAGNTGDTCSQKKCENDCSDNGRCTGNNICACKPGFSGPDCSFKIIPALRETDAAGSDGDDPAIWIHPTDLSSSRIITTVKSTNGAGLNVFDLKGKLISHIDAGEPNNVDIIYNFPLRGPNNQTRKIDLAYAACRNDDTLCLFELTNDSVNKLIPFTPFPTPAGFKVYGSCVYHSQITGNFHLFVNSKTSEYLQYTLTSTDNGNLSYNLTRRFFVGNRGQVEGCVADDDNAAVYIGEEPFGLWHYPAEPTAEAKGTLVDKIKIEGGQLDPDVEGVTLVQGKKKDQGFLIVSNQGVSAFNVYRRTEPWELVTRFTVGGSRDGKIDAVTGTDGVAAVGRALGDGLEAGIVVVHDDVNQGNEREKASFKILGLKEALGENLIKEVDSKWSPRG